MKKVIKFSLVAPTANTKIAAQDAPTPALDKVVETLIDSLIEATEIYADKKIKLGEAIGFIDNGRAIVQCFGDAHALKSEVEALTPEHGAIKVNQFADLIEDAFDQTSERAKTLATLSYNAALANAKLVIEIIN